MLYLKLYLDNCCFNRPFDDQSQLKIYLETQAKLAIQEKILAGEYQLIWSYILSYENAANPNQITKNEINKWKAFSSLQIEESPLVTEYAKKLIKSNISIKDALHVACARVANADYFITTDRKLLNKLTNFQQIRAITPITFIEEQDL
jgi:predicted nucleic acid-binding protein